MSDSVGKSATPSLPIGLEEVPTWHPDYPAAEVVADDPRDAVDWLVVTGTTDREVWHLPAAGTTPYAPATVCGRDNGSLRPKPRDAIPEGYLDVCGDCLKRLQTGDSQ